MYENHRKRRLPVSSRGRRVPNLYVRPKSSGDRREGDTFEVTFRDEAGSQRQKTLNARTVQRAIIEAEEYRSRVRRGEVIPPSLLSFGEIAEEYLDVTESLVMTGERSQRTLDLYRQRLVKHISPAIGHIRIQDVRPEDIGAIFANQRRAGLAPWTISGTQTIISAILKFSLSRGFIITNPLDRLARMEKPRQVSRREARRLNDEDIRQLCSKASPRYQPILTTLAWTGLRVSEALALRWEDLDFEQRELHVSHQLDAGGLLKRPKSRAGVRTVPVLPVVEQTLREHRTKQLALGYAAGDQFIFTTSTGKPLNRNNVRSKGMLPAADRAGLHPEGCTTVTTHDLRRTFVSHLILGLGLDAVRVAKIAGHSNVSVTLNLYADEFDKALHRDDLFARIDKAGFGGI